MEKKELENLWLKGKIILPMINLKQQQIKEIADALDCGMYCYYNTKTHEVREMINFDQNEFADEEEGEELLNEIEENYQDYFNFEKMSPHEAFDLMKDFIEQVENAELRKRLIWILNKSHPFRNFKDEIDYSGEYREKWFTFKLQKGMESVERQIQVHNELEEFNQKQTTSDK